MNFQNLLVFVCLNWSLVNCYGPQYLNGYYQSNNYPPMGYYQIPQPTQRDCAFGQMANLLMDIVLPPTSPQYYYPAGPQPQYGLPPTFQPFQSAQPGVIPDTLVPDSTIPVYSNESPIEPDVIIPEASPTAFDIPEQDVLISEASAQVIDMPTPVFETPIDAPTAIDTESVGGTFIPTADETFIPTAGETFIPTAGETFSPTAGETFIPTAGETLIPIVGETLIPTAGEKFIPTAGETFIPTADETFIPTAVETQPNVLEAPQSVIVSEAQTTAIAVDGPSSVAQPFQPVLMYPVVCGTPVQMVNPCGNGQAAITPNAGGQQVCVCPNVCYCSNPAPVQPVLT